MRAYQLTLFVFGVSAHLFPRAAWPSEQSQLARPVASRVSHAASDPAEFTSGNFTRREQDGTVCKTSGEKQWTGTVDVTDDRRLFYWFFDSRNDPAHDDIIIWLNGGPEATSMRGLFTEVGPCFLEAGEHGTVLNPHSWNKKASLLVIDQPAGVGFSQVKPGGTYAGGDKEAARDLQTFLRLFFKYVFPEKSHLAIHFAGESYGGHYIPSTMKQILDSREAAAESAFWGNITSMVLVNSLIGEEQTSIGLYELFCTDYRGHIWDKDICQDLAQSVPEIEKRAMKCNLLQDSDSCNSLAELGGSKMEYLIAQVVAGKLNWYNIKEPCPHPTKCDPETVGDFIKYLNKPDVLLSLGFPHDFVFDGTSLDAGKAVGYSPERYLPMSSALASILDASSTYSHRRGEEDIRLLVLNGNEDSLCNTPGAKILYERLAWNGAAGYRAQKWKPFTDLGLDIGKGEWKQDEKKQLLFVAVDDAGHKVPMDQPEIADWVIQNWMERNI